MDHDGQLSVVFTMCFVQIITIPGRCMIMSSLFCASLIEYST